MGKKSGGSTTQTVGPDAQTQEYGKQLWQAAQLAGNSAGAPIDPATGQAMAGFQGIAQQGNLGFSALSGDANATARLTSPYQSQVIDQMNQQYALDRGATMNSVNDAATAGGAFGGSRHGVAEGTALAQMQQAHAGQIANTLNTGYSDAMNRAGTLANMGFGAQGAIANLGAYKQQIAAQNDPNMRRLGALSQAMQVYPHGSTNATTEQNGHNGASGFMGGAATGAEIGGHFGPWGAGIGAGLGGLLGMFS